MLQQKGVVAVGYVAEMANYVLVRTFELKWYYISEQRNEESPH